MRKIVILGGGFAGVNAARKLEEELANRRGVEITVVSDRAHFLFTPSWCDVASGTANLAQAEIPLRSILDHPVRVVVDRVEKIETEERRLIGRQGSWTYDHLIIAVGSVVDWRGNDDWAPFSIACKTGRDAIAVREAVDRAFRTAQLATDDAERRRALTFVVAGGGPGGVELAAHIATRIDNDFIPAATVALRRAVRIVLVEPQDTLVPDFPVELRELARTHLDALGVEIRLREAVTGRTAQRVELSSHDAIGADTFFWCGGVRAPQWLRDGEFELDESGRVLVHRNLQAVGQHAVYVVGDVAGAGADIPAKADVAASQGLVAARNVVAGMAGRSRRDWKWQPEPEVLDLGQHHAALLWNNTPVTGKSARALRNAIYSKYLPGTLRKLSLFRSLLGSPTQPGARLLE